jgi:hypothetical protein
LFVFRGDVPLTIRAPRRILVNRLVAIRTGAGAVILVMVFVFIFGIEVIRVPLLFTFRMD